MSPSTGIDLCGNLAIVVLCIITFNIKQLFVRFYIKYNYAKHYIV